MSYPNLTKPSRPSPDEQIAELFSRVRALEATNFAQCPAPDQDSPTLVVNGSGSHLDPTGYTAERLFQICELGPENWFLFGDLYVQMGADAGTGDEDSFYQLEEFSGTFLPNGWIANALGYGYCQQAGATIAYPVILHVNGFQILGLDDTGGGARPGFARPDFPFTFGAEDVLFDGHYQYWGQASE